MNRRLGLALMLLLSISLLLLSACSRYSPVDPDQAKDSYSCEIDADCMIKDVHNCCGYYPRCVNVEFEPDIDAVRLKCQEEGLAGICGFPDITSCECREHVCTSMQGDQVV